MFDAYVFSIYIFWTGRGLWTILFIISQEDMLSYKKNLFGLQTDQYLLLFVDFACLTEMQQIFDSKRYSGEAFVELTGNPLRQSFDHACKKRNNRKYSPCNSLKYNESLLFKTLTILSFTHWFLLFNAFKTFFHKMKIGRCKYIV